MKFHHGFLLWKNAFGTTWKNPVVAAPLEKILPTPMVAHST